MKNKFPLIYEDEILMGFADGTLAGHLSYEIMKNVRNSEVDRSTTEDVEASTVPVEILLDHMLQLESKIDVMRARYEDVN